MEPPKKLSLEEVNKMDYPEFISLFDAILEHGTLAAATVWASRPFYSLQELHHAFQRFIQTLTPESKEGLIRCYPDLAGKLAEENKLSGHSLEEHRGAGLLELSDLEKGVLRALNSSYKEKFGFPFVVCARENKKEAILSGIKGRLENSCSEEAERAVVEIGKIAYHRLNGIIQDAPYQPKLQSASQL